MSRPSCFALVCAALAGGAAIASAQQYRAYVGEIGPDFVLLAWGSTDGSNSIGRSSTPLGTVEVKIAGRTVTVADKNWTYIRELQPDREYPFEIGFQGRRIGGGSVRTWPVKSDKLTFIAIGDWGNGSREQYGVAQALAREVEKRQKGDSPVRFILSLGDTIYGEAGFTGYRRTGSKDSDWEEKFFAPYEQVLQRVPFYAVLGNHDGNETESRGDLPQFLDNFFFPGQQGKPARWFQFHFGGLADFFGLDSTLNTESGSAAPQYGENGPQSKWLAQALPAARAPWKVLFYHNPPFNAGPRHPASLTQLRHWVDLASSAGVSLVLNGHEHNFQLSETSEKTGGVTYIISGSGGELRKGDVRSYLHRANIAAWAAQAQFVLVEIAGDQMLVTPLGAAPVHPVDADGKEIALPIRIQRRGGPKT